jgi:hypothetical protein
MAQVTAATPHQTYQGTETEIERVVADADADNEKSPWF